VLDWDEKCRLVNDARRSLVFAIDRMYHALLFARSIKYDGSLQIVIDLRQMPVPGDTYDCSNDWPSGAPRLIQSAYYTPNPLSDPSKSKISNVKLVSLALNFALALLPAELASNMTFTIISDAIEGKEILNSTVKLLSEFNNGMRAAGSGSVLLGEVGACLVHACF